MAKFVWPFDNSFIQTEDEWEEFASTFLRDGVVKGKYGECVVSPAGGMKVQVAGGVAIVGGFYYREDEAQILNIGPADLSYDRIDLVVLRRTKSGNDIYLEVIQGVPSSSPTPPALQRDADVWDLPLAEVRVTAGASSISSGDITDRREWNEIVVQPSQIQPQGHGSGLSADMVDGRHATDLVWDDYGEVSLGTGWHWVTILEADWYAAAFVNIFADYPIFTSVLGSIIKHGYPGVAWRTLAAAENYGDFRIYAVRIWQSPSDSAVVRLQALAYILPHSGTILRAQVANIGLEYQKTIPSRKAVLVMQTEDLAAAGWHLVDTWVVQNGSWRLARALSGSGATIGWQTPAQMQALFPPNTPAGWNPPELMDGNNSTGLGNLADGYFRAGGNPLIIDGIRVVTWKDYYPGGEVISRPVYVRPDTSSAWQHIGDVRFASNSYQTTTLTFPPRPVKEIWIDNGGGNSNQYIREVTVSLAATLVLRGIPLGSKVRLYDASGTLLEERRNEAWTQDSPVLMSTDASNIAKIVITCPDGLSPWLEFPVWAIDGGALSNGDVLTLYHHD